MQAKSMPLLRSGRNVLLDLFLQSLIPETVTSEGKIHLLDTGASRGQGDPLDTSHQSLIRACLALLPRLTTRGLHQLRPLGVSKP